MPPSPSLHIDNEALRELSTNRAAGHVQYQARQNFRDLCRVYGFGGARQIIAEIINDEAERKSA